MQSKILAKSLIDPKKIYSTKSTGLAKKFIWGFHKIEKKNN